MDGAGAGGTRTDRALLRLGTAAFALLGAQAGAWAVLLADLARVAGIGAPRLGLALTALACVAVPSVLAAGRVIDRLGRRWGVVVGCCGSGVAFGGLAVVGSFAGLLALFLLFGVLCSVYDVVVNVLGGDYERRTGRVTMPRLHAVFSGGGALGALGTASALSLGAGHRAVCVAVGALLVLLGAVGAVTPLPPAPAAVSEEPVPAGGRGPFTALALPGVGPAAALVALQFFNDGAVEGYSSVYLREVLSSGALVGGVGIAAFHAATMAGRLVADRVTGVFGEDRLVACGGAVAAAGYALALGTPRPPLVVAGLLLAGLGAAPVVPLAYSLAARRSGSRSGRAASVVTAFGYVSFVAAPAVVGSLAAVTDLRRALLCLIPGAALIALVGHRAGRVRRVGPGQPEVAAGRDSASQ
ncbi:MFS transporter [Streptomyces sp. TR06-5]|uniref:MFS transporter n=1 Tax=unclassified Streptomyces TaxID=2593676 RepID=UPI0039A17A33